MKKNQVSPARIRVPVIISIAIGCAIALAACAPPAEDAMQAERSAPSLLLVEGAAYPLGVERRQPRLSWHANVVSQAAYQIQVAATEQLLAEGKPDLWDSGKQMSGKSVRIRYEGGALSARQQVFWRVRIWAEGSDTPRAWSPVGRWEMGLLDQADWKASWIGAPEFEPVRDGAGLMQWISLTGTVKTKQGEPLAVSVPKLEAMQPAAYFRREFEITQPVVRARLYSTSAGYSEFFINGEKVGTRVLNPAQTDFDKRIFYDADDVTALLGKGAQTLAAHLGNGFYAERTAFDHRPMFYGEPAIIAQLHIEYADGSEDVIATDGNWLAAPSPVIKNGVYSGEVYDARREIAEWNKTTPTAREQWLPVRPLAQWPTDSLTATVLPPVRRVRQVAPVAILTPEPDVYVFDFGQNFTGQPTLSLRGHGFDSGDAVILRYAEWADEAGNISQLSGGGFATRTHQVDAYIANGRSDESWTPSFTWHGFRYVEVRGLKQRPALDFMVGRLTRSDVERTGRFSSSDPHLNRIHQTALWTYESNLVSVPMDCPIRERNGWTGDAHATVTMANYNFGMAGLWEKYLGDFRTARHVAPSIVPGRRSQPRKVDWAAAEILIAWQHYVTYGDLTVLEEQYGHIQEYVRFIQSMSKNYLFTNEKHLYGDWTDPAREGPRPRRPGENGRSVNTPAALTATALAYRVFDHLVSMAELLGHEEDRDEFVIWRDGIAAAFNAAFLDPEARSYGSQTGDAMALMFGLVPEAFRQDVADSLRDNVLVEWEGHASAGALGQTWLYPALSRAGHTDAAYGVFHAEGYPGFHWLFDTLNATTLWESVRDHDPSLGQPPERSLNHPFKGGYDAWFYSDLAGIEPDESQPGYKHFFLSPKFPADLEWIEASLKTGYGVIESRWTQSGPEIVWTVYVPMNTTATIRGGETGLDGAVLAPGEHRFTLKP